MDQLGSFRRTHYCGELRITHISNTVRVCGWVSRTRDLGSLLFIDLRDRTGIIQLALTENSPRALFEKASSVKSEYVLAVEGVLRERSAKNPELETGSVEIEVTSLLILAQSETPPFDIAGSASVNDYLRLKYRYLDLRNPNLQRNLIIRHKVAEIARSYYFENGFIEIETPILIKSTPEGARDYLVPSRIHNGSFYALPQSPQLYKQLSMVAGFDRYIQIARCFRDEDLRADRQPEFTQIDVEMSFIGQEDILQMTEGFIKRVFREILNLNISDIPRITFREAMEKYGTDKPDLRYALEINDVSDILPETRAIKSPKFSRKQLDKLSEVSKGIGGRGAALHTAKFVTDEQRSAIEERLGGVTEDECVLLFRDSLSIIGKCRVSLAQMLEIIPSGIYKPLWILEMPFFEQNEETHEWEAKHHPFTSPLPECLPYLETDKGAVRAQAYDLVLNGIELLSGSIRVTNPELQSRIFRLLGISEDEAQRKFGYLLDAFRYGAPPHGGIGMGLDRLVMQLLEAESLRDVVAFPKLSNATEPMTASPDIVDDNQLRELGIMLRK